MFAVLSRRARFRMPRIFKKFTVLAFESSADDTCAAVVTSERKILSNVVIGQYEEHVKFGGIQPATAVLAHQKNMPIAAKRAMEEANLDLSGIDGIAFTRGPGMPICLSVACNAAKTLAALTNKPLVGVHHMHAHALTSMLTSLPEDVPDFPFVTLLISGGHTLLVLVESIEKCKILTSTRDEAIGRTLDKVARLLGIGYTGKELEHFYETSTGSSRLPANFPIFTSALKKQPDWSFSGYHSHLHRFMLEDLVEPLSEDQRLGIGKLCITSVTDHLVGQLPKNIPLEVDGKPIQDLVVSGGVASNNYIRRRLEETMKAKPFFGRIKLQFPPVSFCTDNAAMVGWAAMHRFLAGDYDDVSIAPQPRWTIEDLRLLDPIAAAGPADRGQAVKNLVRARKGKQFINYYAKKETHFGSLS